MGGIVATMSPEFGSDPSFLAAYGAVIRGRRSERGLDRKELADQAGISYSYLSAIESGQKMPSGRVQELLSRALGLPAAELLAEANGTLEAGFATGREDRPDIAAHSAMPGPGLAVPFAAAARPAAPPERLNEPPVTTSGVLAELEALVPTLEAEDAALLLSMARRLSTERSQRRPPRRSRDSGRGLRTDAYLHFWTLYLEHLDERGLEWARGRRPEPRSYFTTGSPIRGTTLSASFARNRLLRHELYINRGSRTANLELLHELESRRTLIEATYGRRLEFEDPGRERRAVRVAEYREGTISRSEEYPEYVAWFIDRGIRMRRALEEYAARI